MIHDFVRVMKHGMELQQLVKVRNSITACVGSLALLPNDSDWHVSLHKNEYINFITKHALIIAVIDCGPPPPISNATSSTSTGTTFGAMVSYNCVEGFRISSETASTSCLINGEWSTLPTCSSKQYM